MAGIDSLVGFIWNGASDQSFGIIDPTGIMASFEVDAVLSENHTFSREVTTNPTENGSPIADHIIDQADRLEIQAIVTDQPIKGLLENVESAVDNLLGGSKYTADCFAALLKFKEYKGVLAVYTDYRYYEDMVIESININRAPDDGEALIFTISMVNIRIVTNATTTMPKGVGVKADGKSNATAKETANRANPAKDVGKNTGVEGNAGSILKQASDAGASTIEGLLSKVKTSLEGFGL